jgi:hypothetical protein
MKRLLLLCVPAMIACGSGSKAPPAPVAPPGPAPFFCHSDTDCAADQFCRVETGACSHFLRGPGGVGAVRKGSTAVVGWGPVANATSYEVGTTPRFGGAPGSISASSSTSFVDPDPPPTDGTWYAVRAIVPGGKTEWAYGLLAAVPPPPTDVTTASLIRGIRVTWFNAGSFQNFYTILRGATAAGPFVPIASVQGSLDLLQSYDDASLGVSEQWFYRVVTTFFDVVGIPSAPVSGVTQGPPPPPPAVVTATLVDDGFLPSITWTPSPGALRYQVSLNGGALGTVTGTSFVAVRTRLSTDVTATFAVVAQNHGGDSAPTTSNSITTAPGALYGTVTAIGGVSQAAIRWTDRTRAYPVVYRVLRGPPGGPFRQITSVADFAFTDKTTGDWATFCYEIVVDFGSGQTGPSNVSCTETRGPPDQLNAGTAPLGIVQQDGHTAYGQTFSIAQTGQLIGLEISPSQVIDPIRIVARLFQGDAFLTDVNAQGFLLTPLTAPPVPLDPGTNGPFYLDLSLLNEKIFVAAGGSLRFDAPQAFQPPFQLQLGTTTGDVYPGGAMTIDGIPVSDGRDLVFKTVVRPVPENLVAPRLFPPAPAGDGIRLTWRGIAGAASYRIARSPEGGAAFVDLGPTRDTTFLDASAPGGARFVYRITPVGLSGSVGPASTTLPATPRGALNAQRTATGLVYSGPVTQPFTAGTSGLLTGISVRPTYSAVEIAVTDAAGVRHGPVQFAPPLPPPVGSIPLDTLPVYVDLGALGIHVAQGDRLSFTATALSLTQIPAVAAGSDPGGGFTQGTTFVPDQAIWFQTFVH